jgi:hypothetical protein
MLGGPGMLPTQLIVAVLAFALTGLIPAQQLTAHPQETLLNTSGNIAPFGIAGAGGFAESRCQILVPRQELVANPGPLVAIEVHALSPGPVNYAQLEIRIAPTTATALSTTFAQNFASPPTLVLQASNFQLTYGSGWQRVQFQQPFQHDGTSGIVIEIRKVAQPLPNQPLVTMAASSSPPRTDRPGMVYAQGVGGSGAVNATVANTLAVPIAHRLLWSGASTVRHRSDPSGVAGNQYAIGGSVNIVLQGPAGQLWVVAAALGYLPPGVVVPGLQGEFRLNGAVSFGGGVLDGSGVALQPVGIPNVAALVGLFVVYQGVVVDPAGGVVRFTNAMDHFVNG